MRTIIDYLKENKDVSFEEKEWNTLDFLLVAILAYAPIEGFSKERKFDELIEEILKHKPQKTDDLMAPKVVEIAKILKGGKRYEEMVIEDFDDVINDETQFGAICCLVDGKKVIGFQGTNNSVIGWIENFRLAYRYPTITHKLAVKYLKEHVKAQDKRVYLVGHSKGGNLALVAGIEAGVLRRRKIRKIYNFDGPGLLRKQYFSRKFGRMRRKIINIIPEQSVVGTLLYNRGKIVVKSTERGVLAHYPTSWRLDGEEFLEGRQSEWSRKLHYNTIRGLDKIDEEQVELVFETIFESLETKRKRRAGVGPEDVLSIVKGVAGMDKRTRKYFLDMLGCVLGRGV